MLYNSTNLIPLYLITVMTLVIGDTTCYGSKTSNVGTEAESCADHMISWATNCGVHAANTSSTDCGKETGDYKNNNNQFKHSRYSVCVFINTVP